MRVQLSVSRSSSGHGQGQGQGVASNVTSLIDAATGAATLLHSWRMVPAPDAAIDPVHKSGKVRQRPQTFVSMPGSLARPGATATATSSRP